MNIISVLVIAAVIATVVALVAGIASMVTGEIGHHTSEEWMVARVGLQAGALTLLALALFGG